jgi:signal transduction histidine kinase
MLKIQPRKLDIHRLLEEIASEMTPVAAGKKLNLETDIPQSLPLIMGDGGRIRQVMLNLLSNAFKFTTEGKIIIRVRHDDSSLLVQVEDSGHGIDPEQMEFLFDPYRRKQGSVPRIGGGLGIGLSLCKLFIELHHGKIWVDSTPGKGTIFSFTLPVAQDHISETSDTASIKNLN